MAFGGSDCLVRIQILLPSLLAWRGKKVTISMGRFVVFAIIELVILTTGGFFDRLLEGLR